MEKILKFPKDFLWGAAVSAYQVEGGIENSDWSKTFPAGRACNHYNLYEKDFDLLKELNLNAFRFSVEWSRIEPEEGRFDLRVIEHYQTYLESLKARDIKTMVTLHHFTNPLWLAKQGGWASSKSVAYFCRFANRVFNAFQGLVDFWITINEPLIYSSISYLQGRWPPKKKNIYLFLKVLKNQAMAHKRVYQDFHQMKPDVLVGIAKNNQFFEPFKKDAILDKWCVRLADHFWNKRFLNQVEGCLDFLGLNYYFHNRLKFPFQIKNENRLVSDLGWEIYAEGIYHVLKDLKEYDLPIYITENGVADSQDELRKFFLKEHLFWVRKVIEEGVDVKGYFHWSLMDNFEWDKGFEPRFGLAETDYKTMRRKLRPSALYYAKICKDNCLVL